MEEGGDDIFGFGLGVQFYEGAFNRRCLILGSMKGKVVIVFFS